MVRRLHALALRSFGSLPRPLRRAIVRRISPKFTVGAICVIERADGRMLLVRHSYRRHWGFPGGLLERGESADAGARREVLEEVGIRVDLVGEPSVVVNPRFRRVDVVFKAIPSPLVSRSDGDRGYADAEVPTSVEIVEARWFPPDALPMLQVEASGALVALARAHGQTPAIR